MRRISSLLVAAAALCSLATGAVAAEPGCARYALAVSCQVAPGRIVVGDPFTVTVTVQNTGDTALSRVVVVIKGDLDSHAPAGQTGPTQETIETLAAGESKQVTGTLVCDVVRTTRVIAGASDGGPIVPGRPRDSWASANCVCTFEVIGLPAIQSEMSDKDAEGGEKGIFRVGESFLYVLDVQNDAGSTVTPDLMVEYTLPKELEFVSGIGEKGVTVTGSGQTAATSVFALGVNQKQRVSITVRVVSAPPSNLVQARASIKTSGGVEVAEETESTTVKQ
jgi:hypothetical protein